PLGAAAALSALAFTAHHVVVLAVYFPGPTEFLTVVLPFALCVGVGGAVWAWLYDRAQSLYAPWLSHLIIDAAILVVGYDLVAPGCSSFFGTRVALTLTPFVRPRSLIHQKPSW